MAFTKTTINAARYDYTKHRTPQINDEPSLTIPDQAMSMREILDRFGAGRSVPTAIQEVYEEDGKEIFDTSRMSKIEKAEAARGFSMEIYEARQKLKQIEKYQNEDGTQYIDPNAKPPPTLPTEETPTT